MAYENEINRLKEMQKQQALLNLEKQKQSSLSQLTAEKSQIQPKYYDARNQASVNSQLQARNFAEYLASRGQANSGLTGYGELMRGAGLQSEIGALKRDETSRYADLARRESDVVNNYNNSLASSYNEIEMNAANKLLEYREQLRREAQARASAKKQQDNNPYNDTGVNNPTYQAFEALDAYMKGTIPGKTADDFLRENRLELIKDLGPEGYYNLIKQKQMRERELKGMM